MSTKLAPVDDKVTSLVPYDDYAADAGAGFEGTDRSDFMVPILSVLQSKSPEVELGTLEGAKAGGLIIRALGRVFDGVKGLPRHDSKSFRKVAFW